MKKSGAKKKAAKKAFGVFAHASNPLEKAYNSIASLIQDYGDMELGRVRLSNVKDPKYDNFVERQQLMEVKKSSNDICSICLDKFTSASEFAVLKCGHCYHEKCVMTWLSSNDECPMCRAFVK